MEGRVILITQARVGSSRMPFKVTKEISGKSILRIQLERVSGCRSINDILVAVPFGIKETPIHNICSDMGIKYSIGSEEDVLDRYYQAAKNSNANWVVRITSDCPLIDPILVDHIVQKVSFANKDYGSNTIIETYPDGQDIEVFKFEVLEKAWKLSTLKSDREHVTPFIKRNCESNNGTMFTSLSIENDLNYSDIRMTVDELLDFQAIELLVNELGDNASWKDYTKFIINNKILFNNQKITRNEGYFNSLQNDK